VPRIGEDNLHLPIAPLLAPLAQGEHHRQQAFTLWRERVNHPPSVLRIRGAREDASGDELRQAIRQDVAGDPEATLEFLEMLEPVERSAQDQERPFLADQLDRRGKRARQGGFLERVEVRGQRISRHKPFSPQANLIKAHKFAKKQLPSETDMLFSSKSQLLKGE